MTLYERICTPHLIPRHAAPYLIAEAGVNHEADLATALEMVRVAASAGADAIKFQSYKAEALASVHSPAYWDTTKEKATNQYMLFKKYDKFWKTEFEKLARECDVNNIEFLSTPFDYESADFLNDLMPVFKIASADITNFPMISKILKYGKPILFSTGASYISEIAAAIDLAKTANVPCGVMHCTLAYPTRDEDANLGMIEDLGKKFPDHLIGYSDHTLPGDMFNLLTASAMGAQVIEKHFTLNKSLEGNDHYHAMDVDDLRYFRAQFARFQELIGLENKTVLEVEQASRLNARRSLVAMKRIPVGHKLTDDNVGFKRPGTGISPIDWERVRHSVVTRDISVDEVIFEADIQA